MNVYVLSFMVLSFISQIFGGSEEFYVDLVQMQAHTAKFAFVEIDEWINEKENVSILFTGDVMCHGTQLRGAYDSETDTYDFKDVFLPLKPYVEKADYSVLNFETVTAGKEKRYRGYPTFNTPDTIIDALENVGFDMFLTANNHCLDVGKFGLEKTIDEIKKRNLDQTGTFKDIEPKPFLKEIKGVKFAFINYTYGCNGMENAYGKDELEKMVNIINYDRIEKDVIWAKDNADIIICVMHWGNEYQRKSNNIQKDLANKLLMLGVDAVIGSHPHVVQESEWYPSENKNQYVIYSMGNLVSNQRRETLSDFRNCEYTEDGVLVLLNFEKNIWNDEIYFKDVSYEPTWVERYRVGNGYKFHVLPTREYLEEQKHLNDSDWEKIKQSYENTMSQMN